MKKITALVLVLCMMLAFGVSVYAGYDPTKSPNSVISSEEGEISELPDDEKPAREWKEVTSVEEFCKEHNIILSDSSRLSFLRLFIFKPTSGTTVVTFRDTGDGSIKAGQRIVVFRYTNSGTWEVVFSDYADKNGEVTVDLGSDEETVIAICAQSTGGDKHSDETGEAPVGLVLVCGMLFFGAMTTVSLKRREN